MPVGILNNTQHGIVMYNVIRMGPMRDGLGDIFGLRYIIYTIAVGIQVDTTAMKILMQI